MTKEEIEARIALLREDKQNAINLVRTLDGAIQECQYWLDHIPQEAPQALAAVENT